MSKETKIISGVGIVFFALFAFLIYSTSTGTETSTIADKDLLIGQMSQMTGKRDARVTIVEFGDYQCPACAYANPIVQRILNIYRDNPDVNFVSRNFPLSQHANGMISAEAAEAAGAQGKFWEMGNILFERQNEWSGSPEALEVFAGYAKELGLDVKAFTDSVNQKKFQDIINKDLSDARALGVNSTPTFFINGKKFEGVLGIDSFKKEIDERLQTPSES